MNHTVRKSTPRFTNSPSLVLIRQGLTEIQRFKNFKIKKEMYGIRTLCRTASGWPYIFGLKIHAAKTKVMKAKKQVQTTCDGRWRRTGGSQRLQVPWELHFIRQQHRQRGVYQNWSRSSAFKKLNNIWKSTTLSTKTKLRT